MIRSAIFLLSIMTLLGCAGGSHVAGNERGSQPLTDHEAAEYKRAVLKCYKTGGTRVVKVEGVLRCYD